MTPNPLPRSLCKDNLILKKNLFAKITKKLSSKFNNKNKPKFQYSQTEEEEEEEEEKNQQHQLKKKAKKKIRLVQSIDRSRKLWPSPLQHATLLHRVFPNKTKKINIEKAKKMILSRQRPNIAIMIFL
jgi:hypothetical protein